MVAKSIAQHLLFIHKPTDYSVVAAVSLSWTADRPFAGPFPNDEGVDRLCHIAQHFHSPVAMLLFRGSGFCTHLTRS